MIGPNTTHVTLLERVAKADDHAAWTEFCERYGPLIEALYNGSTEQYIETEMTFEDGRKGVIRATVKVADAEVLPASNAMPEAAE